jgi:A118 family predicted phage portal protein
MGCFINEAIMFQRILQWIKEVVNKMISIPTLKQGLKIDVAINPLMIDALQKWSAMYINEPSWKVGEIKTLNLPAAIASEIARAVTIEMDVQVSGSPRADFLALQLAPVLNNVRTNTEYACAKGGIVAKPYPRGNTLVVDWVQADMFYPVAFDSNGNMTACVFADQKTIGQYFYTRLEFHRFAPGIYQITNTAWQSSVKDTLGTQIPLTQVSDWAELAPEATILNIEKPLFAYFKMPFANNIDTSSPLGVSVYSRATDLIEQADRQWTDFLWEFESGKRALYTDALAFGKGSDNKPKLPNSRLYRLLDLNSKIDGKGFFEDWTPTIREVNLLNGLDAMLRRIEFNCGLSYGVLSNPEAVALTATEIKAAKQRFYVTVSDTQKALQDTFDSLLYAMDVWTTLGNLAPRGAYTVNYQFDDSIVTDEDAQFAQDQQAVTQNTMPKYVFNMRNYGLDEATAKQWVEDAKSESPAPSFFPNEGL